MGNTTGKDFLEGTDPTIIKKKGGKDASPKKIANTITKGADSTGTAIKNWGEETWKSIQDLPEKLEDVFFTGIERLEDGFADGLNDFGQLEIDAADTIVKEDDAIITAILPKIFETMESVITNLLPELLSLPSNIIIYFMSIFITLAGISYVNTAAETTRRNAPLEPIPYNPALLHEDLEPDDVITVINSVLG